MKTRIYKAILTALLILAMAGSAMGVPTEWDWRDVNGINYMTPAKSQGSCGSCWAFATVSCMESAYKIYGDPNTDLDLSEQYLVSDCFMYGDCSGGFADDVFERAENVGIPTEECYPYVGYNTPCSPCADWENGAYRIEGYLKVDRNTAAYKQAIMDYGPLAAVIHYAAGDHAICVVGWDDTTGNWIYKNSRGPTWGDGGYGEIPFGDIENVDDAYVITDMFLKWTTPVSAFASSEQTSYPAEKAIDGEYRLHTDAWKSDNEIPCWIQFDLGELLTVDSVYMALYDWGGSTRFDIDISQNNVTWTNIVEGATVPSIGEMFEAPIGAEAQHIRLTITAGSIGMCYEFGYILAPCTCKGDFCGATGGSSPPDGYIGQFDLVAFGMAYDSVVGDPNYNVIGDFDDDGNVDLDDFMDFVDVYEEYCN